MRKLTLLLALAIGLTGPAAAQTIERIRETGELKLGYRTDAAPLSYANEDGDAAGYSPLLCIGIANAISERLGLEKLHASFHPVSAQDRFDKIASGEIDLLCGAATITLGRREVVDFSIPTYVDGAVVLLPRNAGTAFKALDGKRIGVRSGTTTETALKNSIKTAGISAEEIRFDSHDDGVLALQAGEIDAYFADQSILIYQLLSKELGSELQLTNQLLTIEKHGLAMARGDTEFRLMVDQIVSNFYRTNTIERIYDQTLGALQPGLAMKALHMIAPTLP